MLRAPAAGYAATKRLISSYYRHFIQITSPGKCAACIPYSGRRRRSFSTRRLYYDEDEAIDNLIRLHSAQLGFPNDRDASSINNDRRPALNLDIQSPNKRRREGCGHALLGKNGCGKTLVSSAISYYNNGDVDGSKTNNNNPYILNDNGTIEYNQKWYDSYISKVSFQSHSDLLTMNTDDTNDTSPLTVYRALTPYGGRLNKATQYLVVRFGLYPLLHKDVNTISTGEIRKVLLVRSLSFRPKLLILDNAFDGLDVPSREMLKDLVSKTLKGFRPDLLVQDVDARNTAHTQVMLITHRSEEIVNEISTISMIRKNITTKSGDDDDVEKDEGFRTEQRNNRTGSQLLRSALTTMEEENDEGDDGRSSKNNIWPSVDVEEAETWNSLNDNNTWNDSTLPSNEEIYALWQQWSNNNGVDNKSRRQQQQANNPKQSNGDDVVVVEANHLRVQRGEHIPISNLNWKVHKGQRWLIAGGNGAGKSTLSRLLAHINDDNDNDSDEKNAVNNDASCRHHHGITDGSLRIDKEVNIGWVSTELHMHMAHSKETARDVLMNKATATSAGSRMYPYGSGGVVVVPSDVADAVTRWLQIPHDILSHPFYKLSQGEQKLILIGAAIAKCPSLLILDEPCQGLDILSRRRVLGLVERLCMSTSTGMSLIYITHHYEELIPSVSNVLHLVEGKVVYNGERHSYDPSTYNVVVS